MDLLEFPLALISVDRIGQLLSIAPKWLHITSSAARDENTKYELCVVSGADTAVCCVNVSESVDAFRRKANTKSYRRHMKYVLHIHE